jgi:hypothetical protein
VLTTVQASKASSFSVTTSSDPVGDHIIRLVGEILVEARVERRLALGVQFKVVLEWKWRVCIFARDCAVESVLA